MNGIERVVELRESEILFLKGEESFLLAGKAERRFPLIILGAKEEYVQALEKDDIIAVSAPEGGSIQAAAMLLELVRTHHLPLVVLPSGHPGSKRLRYVVSAGSEMQLDCSIKRGTHPEQHLLCSSGELEGIHLSGIPGAIRITRVMDAVQVDVIPSYKTLVFSEKPA